MKADHTDIIIIGAGLSGVLAAWRILAVNPDISVTLIDAADKIGGDQTWAFNWSDLTPEVHGWAQEFVAHQWDKYDVKFPKRDRQLDISYCAGNSDSLRGCVQPFIDTGRLTLMLNTKAAPNNAESVTLENGQILKAGWVLDARGFEKRNTNYLGYQKFAGKTIKTKAPHGLEHPIIMDAAVDQQGGYRFMSCLPFSDHEILVKDTYYPDGPDLAEDEIQARLDSYIQDKGWGDHEVLHHEVGVLPTKLAIDDARFETWAHESGQATPLGIRAGYYHAVTGYSLPQAMKSAWLIADKIKSDGGKLKAAQMEMDQHEFDHYCEEKFLRLLNRVFVNSAKPEKRYKFLQGLYGLPTDAIERFYAGQYSRKDQIRILLSQPILSLHKVLTNFKEARFISAEKAS